MCVCMYVFMYVCMCMLCTYFHQKYINVYFYMHTTSPITVPVVITSSRLCRYDLDLVYRSSSPPAS